MLMLILQNPLATDKQLYFNTSHVNVNQEEIADCTVSE